MNLSYKTYSFQKSVFHINTALRGFSRVGARAPRPTPPARCTAPPWGGGGGGGGRRGRRPTEGPAGRAGRLRRPVGRAERVPVGSGRLQHRGRKRIRAPGLESRGRPLVSLYRSRSLVRARKCRIRPPLRGRDGSVEPPRRHACGERVQHGRRSRAKPTRPLRMRRGAARVEPEGRHRRSCLALGSCGNPSPEGLPGRRRPERRRRPRKRSREGPRRHPGPGTERCRGLPRRRRG